MPRNIFFYHPESGKVGTLNDVTEKSRAERFFLNFTMLNTAQPGWIVVDSHDEREMGRVRAGH